MMWEEENIILLINQCIRSMSLHHVDFLLNTVTRHLMAMSSPQPAAWPSLFSSKFNMPSSVYYRLMLSYSSSGEPNIAMYLAQLQLFIYNNAPPSINRLRRQFSLHPRLQRSSITKFKSFISYFFANNFNS